MHIHGRIAADGKLRRLDPRDEFYVWEYKIGYGKIAIHFTGQELQDLCKQFRQFESIPNNRQTLSIVPPICVDED